MASTSGKLYEYKDFMAFAIFIYQTVGFNLHGDAQETKDQMKGPNRRPHRILAEFYKYLAIFCHFYYKYYLLKLEYTLIWECNERATGTTTPPLGNLTTTIEQHDIACTRNIFAIIRTAAYIAYANESTIKFLAYLWYRQRLLALYEAMQSIYPKTSAEKCECEVDKYYWSESMRMILVGFVIVCNVILIEPVIQSVVMLWRNGRFGYLKTYPNLYDIDHRTPIGYVLAMTTELINAHFMGVTHIGNDIWLISFIIQIRMHGDYIARQLTQYEPSHATQSQDCAFLRSLIARHQHVMALTWQLNEIYKYTLIFTLLSSGGIFCTLATTLSSGARDSDFYQYSVLFLLLVVQLYLVCYFAHKLIDMNEQIARAAYLHSWYNGSQRYRKMLLIFLTGVRKQAHVTAQGMQPISLLTFKAVCSMAYQVFALLRSFIN